MTTLDGPKAITFPIDKIQPQELRWLWPGVIPRGKLTVLAGDPGLGKSFLTLDIAARVSWDGEWPLDPEEAELEAEMEEASYGEPPSRDVRDLERLRLQHRPPRPERVPDRSGAPGGCAILLNAEDDPADTIRPRLEALDASLRHVYVLDSIRDERGQFRDFVIDENVQELRRVIDQLHTAVAEPRLVVIDPVSAFVGMTDSYNNAQVRAMLKPLSDLAADTGVAVVLVTHLRKSGEGSAVQRAMGSLAFTAAARVVLTVTRHPTDPDLRVLSTAKSNLAPDRRGYVYEIEDGRLVWHGRFDACADEVMSGERRAPGRKVSIEMRAFEGALRQRLGAGGLPVDEVRELSRVHGVKWDTAKSPATKRRLGVEVEREEGVWMWRLVGANESMGDTG